MSEHTLAPIQLPSVADVVYDILRKQILHGKFAPNQQINLNKLESELDVSRTPLKTALARLQSEGLVEIHPRRGTYVMQFNATDIQECYDLRIALEAEALRYAFEARNTKAIQHILAHMEKMATYFATESVWLEQLLEYMDMDRWLHIAFVKLSGNSRMQQAYEHANVQGYIAIMGTKFQYEDSLKTQQEHGNILQALENQDLTTLLHASRSHLELARDRALLRLTEHEDAE